MQFRYILDGKYNVSDLGQIINPNTNRVLHQFIGKDGYVRCQFGGKTRLVHRVILSAFINQPDEKKFVNHIDGNKTNNSLSNLEWCTRSENMKHAYLYNLKSSKGEKNSRCKLSSSDVDYIRKAYIRGDHEYGELGLAKKFGVSRTTIGAVICKQNWN